MQHQRHFTVKRRAWVLLSATVLLIMVAATHAVGSIAWADRDVQSPTATPTPSSWDQPDRSLSSHEEPVGYSAPASPQSVETLYVPADGTSKQTQTVLASGQTYTFRISGVIAWGGCDPTNCPGNGPEYVRWADAAFMTDDYFHTRSQQYVYLTVNGARPNLGVYNASHVYQLTVSGNGAQATFRVADCSYCYVDNRGSLRVELLGSSEPAAIALGVLPNPQYSIFNNQYAGWGSDRLGNPNTSTAADTICRWGCFMSSWAEVIDFYGFQYGKHITPRDLNGWLREHGGYSGNYLVRAKVAEYANELWHGLDVYFMPIRESGRDDQKLHDLLAAGYPVVLKLNLGGANTHYVVAVGEIQQGGSTTWYINDPGGCSVDLYTFPQRTLLTAYGNSYSAMYYATPLTGPVQLASITLVLASPAELLVTDPQGRRTGLDPRTGIAYNEIPEATYQLEQLGDDENVGGADTHPIKVFEWVTPSEGEYTVEVIGTGDGPYTLRGLAYDAQGGSSEIVASGTIQQNAVDTISLSYSPDPGGTIILHSTFYLPLISR